MSSMTLRCLSDGDAPPVALARAPQAVASMFNRT
jgi:hypothetical protein